MLSTLVQPSAVPGLPIVSDRKTFIGVLASHDDPLPNKSLALIFTHLRNHPRVDLLNRFHFLVTGGTWDRLFYGDRMLDLDPLSDDVAAWLKARATRLPTTKEGGVIILSYLVCQRECSIVWPLFAPNASHWQRHENLAFTRLCDQWHVKRLMNRASVMVWFDNEATVDVNRNLQCCPPQLTLRGLKDGEMKVAFDSLERAAPEAWAPDRKAFGDMTIALIAHDNMKSRMIEFAIDHEAELDKFGRILATGTTGREVAAATSERIHDKMIRFHSGPKGGDIEIATMILYYQCHVVIFFVDPLEPHPHIEDIRVVFQSCMIRDQVVMITNEVHAREFMSHVVREHDEMTLYG